VNRAGEEGHGEEGQSRLPADHARSTKTSEPDRTDPQHLPHHPDAGQILSRDLPPGFGFVEGRQFVGRR
jgi:hypothetical protein